VTGECLIEDCPCFNFDPSYPEGDDGRDL
jgi:hypothetical protein